MDHYDVIVVGARPAGAATAMLLARAGHRVLVLDRMRPGSDTLSTHALMRAGVLQLERWGLLDRVVAAGTPAVRRVTFHYGTRQVPIDMRAPLYAPRRTVLDPILADAAIESGAQIRFGTRVEGLLHAEGRVAGVHGVDVDGTAFAATADMVVGADGRTSLVAREVGAANSRRGRHASGAIYAYFEGVEADGYHWAFMPGSMAVLIPTNGGLTCVYVGVTQARLLSGLRGDLRGAIRTVLSAHDPALVRRVDDGRMVTRPRGFPGVPGWLRVPHGPGWALVGDAGYFKDPATAHGMTDALRDAELLARALHAGLTGAGPMDVALAGYARTRDTLSSTLFDATDAVAGHTLSMAELQQVHLDLSRAMQEEVRHLADLRPFAGVRPRRSAA